MKNDPQDIKKRKAILLTLGQVALIFVMLMLLESFDFFNFSFDFTKIQTRSYWNNTILQSVLYAIALVTGYLGAMEDGVLKNKDYSRLLDEYRSRYKIKQNSESFTPWIDNILNPRIQKEYYIRDIELKLNKLEKRVKDEYRLDFMNLLKSGKKFEEFEFCCEKSKIYAKKRLTLEALIKKDVIDEQAKSFFDYPKISPYSFTYGINAKEKYGEQYKVVDESKKYIAFGFTKKILSVILTSMFLASIFADIDGMRALNNTTAILAMIVTYTTRALSICWSYINGRFFGKFIFKKNYILVLENRNRILDQFIGWEAKHGDDNSPTKKILNYLENQNKTIEEEPKKEVN